jgi:hypothetical protein
MKMTTEGRVNLFVRRMVDGETYRQIYDSPYEALQHLFRDYLFDMIYVDCVDGTARGVVGTKRVKKAIPYLWKVHQEKGISTLPVDLMYRFERKAQQGKPPRKNRGGRPMKIMLNKKRRVNVLWRDRPELNKG